MSLRDRYEIATGEHLKTVAEQALHVLGKHAPGRILLEGYATAMQGHLQDPALETDVAGLVFENPVIVGAGWDKRGRAIHGLYSLGFAGAEIGTVTDLPQAGGPKPRLWTIDEHHSVGFNSLGFNSVGSQQVADNLDAAMPFPFPVGINVGRNKDIPNEEAAAAHNQVIRRLGPYASYIVLGISSPNTPDLRGLQTKEPLRELIQAARQDMPTGVPLLIKIDSERTPTELDDIIEVLLEESADGVVAANSYTGRDLKQKYGERWAQAAGGLSGADPEYRARTTATVKHIHEVAGDKLAIIGVGGVDSPGAALEKMMAGASAVEVVTAIRPSLGRIATHINNGLIEYMARDGVKNIREYVGTATERGVV